MADIDMKTMVQNIALYLRPASVGLGGGLKHGLITSREAAAGVNILQKASKDPNGDGIVTPQEMRQNIEAIKLPQEQKKQLFGAAYTLENSVTIAAGMNPQVRNKVRDDILHKMAKDLSWQNPRNGDDALRRDGNRYVVDAVTMDKEFEAAATPVANLGTSKPSKER